MPNHSSQRIFDTERLILWIRLATIPFALLQIFTYYMPYPDGILNVALGLVAILTLGNVFLWYAHRTYQSKSQIIKISYGAMAFDTLMVFGFVSLFTFDVNTAVFILVYMLPLEAAARFGRKGAFWIMAVVAILYSIREYIGSQVYDYDFLIVSITFRMGMGFVIAAIAGTMAVSWLRERKRIADLYEHEKRAKDALRDVDNMKNNFLSAVAHELRTPLTSIMGFSMTLQDQKDGLSDIQNTMVDTISAESQRLHALLEDLLDVNRLSQGLVDVNRSLVDLEKTFREVSSRIYSFSGRETTLLSCAKDANIDQMHLERILENLLINASKYTPQDSPINVKIDTYKEGILIIVQDQGLGVPDEYKQSIFKPFQRGLASSSHNPGTGVGLSLVSQLAQLHDGYAWVEDNEPNGAIFKVYLRIPSQA